MRIPRARITAPAVHACLFVGGYVYWLLFERSTHHPGRLDLITIVWIADLPISALASFMTLGIGLGVVGPARTAFAFIVWAVLGTIWWYFPGHLYRSLDSAFLKEGRNCARIELITNPVMDGVHAWNKIPAFDFSRFVLL